MLVKCIEGLISYSDTEVRLVGSGLSRSNGGLGPRSRLLQHECDSIGSRFCVGGELSDVILEILELSLQLCSVDAERNRRKWWRHGRSELVHCVDGRNGAGEETRRAMDSAATYNLHTLAKRSYSSVIVQIRRKRVSS